MTLFVDTTVWSLALRRDQPPNEPEVAALTQALGDGLPITTTGIVLQELLQGFAGPKAADAIINRFRDIPLLVPDRQDHIAAATLRNACRRSGIQAGSIDALIAQLCIRHELTLLTTDRDFRHMQKMAKGLRLWGGG